jgi:hypothetical protein
MRCVSVRDQKALELVLERSGGISHLVRHFSPIKSLVLPGRSSEGDMVLLCDEQYRLLVT